MAEEAAVHYDKVAEAFIEFQQLFPFPQGGEPNDPANAEEAIRLLEQAKVDEASRVAVLERMREELTCSEKP
ncbi:hypothetical protein ACFPPD_02070 [Cohnella suwonensis]|uniref:Uncharacterized protein n=1 Tax=Cohnella suwonensis TaxID=696072 RepID=A0ABW0LQ88_9BACL